MTVADRALPAGSVEDVVPLSGGGWCIDRRTFLRVAGAAATAVVAGPVSLAGTLGASPGVGGPADPVLDLAGELGFDLERLFRFVAEEIRYEPYAGVLRGADGTLVGGAGNAADQAVLLAALLEASGIPYRFAVGPLTEAGADALLADAVVTVEEARRQTRDALAGTGPGGRPFPAIEPTPDGRARIEEARARADGVVAWAEDQLATTVATIESALRAAGVDLPSAGTALPPLERDRHIWVQARSGTEWIDLDPSLPSATLGDAPAPLTELLEALPAELRHIVRFRVIAETVRSGALADEILLEVEQPADLLSGEPIGFLNLELGGLRSIGVSILAALEGGTTYVPCLIVGDEVLVGPGVLSLGGDPPGGPLGGPGPSPGGVRDGDATAEWLEITTMSPGTDPVTIRRPVFDRIGPAVRAAGSFDPATLGPVSLVQLDPSSPPDHLPAQTSHWLTVHTGVEGGADLERSLRPGSTDAPSLLPATVRWYHVIREAALAQLALPAGIRAFVDRPNIVSLTIEQRVTDDGSLVLEPVLDIWHRSFGTRSVADAAPSMPPATTVGVVAHVAERLAHGDAARDPSAADEAAPSVGAIFDAVRRDAIPLRVVATPGEADGLPFGTDVLARLREAVSAGHIAVVPERAVVFGEEERTGWWLVDPRSGMSIDQLDDGRGALPGRVVVQVVSVQAQPSMLRLGACVLAGAIIAATGALAGSDGADLPVVLGLGVPAGGGAMIACAVGGF